mgnify:CR=1 FL=1
MASADSPAGPAVEPGLDGRKLFTFLCMVFGMFMAILDIQIVSSSLSELQAGLACEFKHLRGRWPIGRVALQHLAHKASQLRRVAVAHRIILARSDALAQDVEVDLLAVEGRAQLGHLVQEAAERPEHAVAPAQGGNAGS